MEMDKIQGMEQKPKTGQGGLKKMGNSLLGGLIFGLTAGLVIVVMLSLFPRNGNVDTLNNHTETEAAEEKVSGKDGEKKADSQGSVPEGGDIQTAESTAESQTVVTDVTKVVDNVMPCVVSIFSTYVVDEDFWGYHYDYEAEGGGSGIIVGENETELLIVDRKSVV